MNLGHAHKTRFWYLLEVFSKFSDEHPRHFYRGVPPPPPTGAANVLSHPHGLNGVVVYCKLPLMTLPPPPPPAKNTSDDETPAPH